MPVSLGILISRVPGFELSWVTMVVRSSVAVYSGFRFCRRAKELGPLVSAINDGVTRADEFLGVEAAEPCAEGLAGVEGVP